MAFEMSDSWKASAVDQSASSKQLWLINSITSTFPHFVSEFDTLTFPLNKLEASEVITKLKALEKKVKAK